MELSSHTGSGKAHESSLSTHPEVLPEEVEPSKEPPTKDMELSSHTRSGKDHQSSSDEQDALLEETELSSYSGSDKEYRPSSTPSSDGEMSPDKSKSSSHNVTVRPLPERDCCHSTSSEEEVLEAEQQATRRRSSQPGERLKKGKRKKKVTVKTTKKRDSGRAWDKAHYCLYCKKANLKMARHLQRKHNDETDVAHAFSFPPGSKQRKTLLESLRNKGDWQHNLKVLEDGSGEIVTWKQPSKGASVEDYLPCQHCYAMFKRKELWRHMKSCREKKGDKVQGKRRAQKASSELIPIKDSSEGLQKIIHSMIQDHVTSHIRGDEMICTYGNALFAKKGREQSQHRYIAQKMRELGRFCLAAKEIDKSVKGLKDVCDPTKFKLAIKAARRVSNYSTARTEYGKPSTAVKIGFSLKGATETWIGHCLMTSDVLNEKKAKKFKELLDSSWSNYVSTNAHSFVFYFPLNIFIEKQHEVISAKGSRGVKARQISFSDRQLEANDDGALPHPSPTSSRPPQVLSRRKKAQRHDDDDGSDGDGSDDDEDAALPRMSVTSSQVKHRKKAVTTQRHDDDDEDAALPRLSVTSSQVKHRKKAVTTQRHDDDDEDGALPHPSPTSSRVQRRKKARRHDDDRSDGDESEGDEDAALPRLSITSSQVKHRKKAVTTQRDDDDEDGALPHPSPTSSRVQRRKKARRHDDDEDLPCSPPTGSPVQRRKKAVTKRRHDDGDEDGALPHPSPASSHVQHGKKARRYDDDESDDDKDGGLPHPSPTSSCVQRRKKAQRHDDDDDDDEDGNKQPRNTTRQKRVKKIAAKRKYHADADAADDDDGERQNVSSTRPTVKRLKKTANKTQHNDDDVSKVQTKRPWSVEERTAVLQRMTKFVALRKVPAKNDCLLCIKKESPVLSTRTWKDVKYFVYNEIVKVKKKLAF
ncbi:hypothetical protein ABVT39_012227 [Epinephelus coioides]